MLKVKGKYNEAIIYTDSVEEEALKQILELCNQLFYFCKFIYDFII